MAEATEGAKPKKSWYKKKRSTIPIAIIAIAIAANSGGGSSSKDSSAELYDNKAGLWLKDINPGNALVGTVYFDIPKDATIDYLELHDSAFSDGVKVYAN